MSCDAIGLARAITPEIRAELKSSRIWFEEERGIPEAKEEIAKAVQAEILASDPVGALGDDVRSLLKCRNLVKICDVPIDLEMYNVPRQIPMPLLKGETLELAFKTKLLIDDAKKAFDDFCKDLDQCETIEELKSLHWRDNAPEVFYHRAMEEIEKRRRFKNLMDIETVVINALTSTIGDKPFSWYASPEFGKAFALMLMKFVLDNPVLYKPLKNGSLPLKEKTLIIFDEFNTSPYACNDKNDYEGLVVGKHYFPDVDWEKLGVRVFDRVDKYLCVCCLEEKLDDLTLMGPALEVIHRAERVLTLFANLSALQQRLIVEQFPFAPELMDSASQAGRIVAGISEST